MGQEHTHCKAVARLVQKGEGILLREPSLRAHVSDCRKCLQALWQADPLLVFSFSSTEPLSDHFWKGGWENLQERIERSHRGARVTRRRALSAAAFLCIGVLLTFFFLPGEERQVPERTQATMELLSSSTEAERYPLVEESEMSYTLLRAEDGTRIVYFFFKEPSDAE